MWRDDRIDGDGQAGLHAGPSILLGGCHHGGPDRIELDVTMDDEQVALRAHQAGLEASLPQRPGTPMLAIEGRHVRPAGPSTEGKGTLTPVLAQVPAATRPGAPAALHACGDIRSTRAAGHRRRRSGLSAFVFLLRAPAAQTNVKDSFGTNRNCDACTV